MAEPRHTIELTVIEGNCPPHPVGSTYQLPQDAGRICPWLQDSIGTMVRVLMLGGTLPWQYPSPYEKEMDPEGVTTEYVRCPDPTSRGIVVRITRRRVG